jgi:hypothetical protein
MGKIISFEDFSKKAKKLAEEDLIMPIQLKKSDSEDHEDHEHSHGKQQ